MRALLDTNILIALTDDNEPTPDLDPFESVAVSVITWTELSVGLHAAQNLGKYKQRLRHLTQLRQIFGPGLPFDETCDRAFDVLVEASVDAGGQAQGQRIDRMIAATAVANGLSLVTRNPSDFKQLEGHLNIVTV